MPANGKADELGFQKATSCPPPETRGEQGFPGVKEPGMLHNDITVSLPDPAYSSSKEYGKQPIQREDIK